MTSVPSTCPLTIFVTLPCPALSGQGRAGQVFYILQGSSLERNSPEFVCFKS